MAFDKSGVRLVSAVNLRQTHTPQMVVPHDLPEQNLHPETHQVSYGMAWVIQDYRGLKMVAHSGVLDGFRIQLTLVPVNVKVARAPGTAGVTETAAVPPLHAFVVSPCVQPLVNVVAVDVSSVRSPRIVGGTPGVTSNASTTTA